MRNLYEGRINRGTFAIGFTIILVVLLAVYFISVILLKDSSYLSIISILLYLFFVTILYSLYIRRLHDLGRSGWWILTGFIPLVMFALIIIFLFLKGNKEDNKYGVPSGGRKFLDEFLNKKELHN